TQELAQRQRAVAGPGRATCLQWREKRSFLNMTCSQPDEDPNDVALYSLGVFFHIPQADFHPDNASYVARHSLGGAMLLVHLRPSLYFTDTLCVFPLVSADKFG